MAKRRTGSQDKHKRKTKKAPKLVSCRLRICEDPQTGKIKYVQDGPCPPGFFERIARKAARDGIEFELKD